MIKFELVIFEEGLEDARRAVRAGKVQGRLILIVDFLYMN